MKRLLIYIIVFFYLSLSMVTVNKSSAKDTLPKSKFSILLSNDDGYNAPGIKALAEALAPIATLIVAAPINEQTGASHGITIRELIFVKQINNPLGIQWYSISAKPATCVHIGLEHFVDRKPDLVISGINEGENVGPLTFRSGTVGAAREAAILGLPAIAVSLQGNNKDDYKAAAVYIRQLVKNLASKKLLKSKLLLNINFPSSISKGIKGTKVTKLSLVDEKNVSHRINIPFSEIYKVKITKPIADNDPETDINALSNGYVTITPLSIDQTDHAQLGLLQDDPSVNYAAATSSGI